MFRETRFGVRCNEVERQALVRLAEQERRTPSEMLRELVREKARERGLWPVNEQQEVRYGG